MFKALQLSNTKSSSEIISDVWQAWDHFWPSCKKTTQFRIETRMSEMRGQAVSLL